MKYIGNIDILIRGAKVVDGTGNPWYYGDVAISGDRVLEIAPPGRIPAEAAREVVDAEGMVICPGFIDILSHSHIPLMHDPRALSKITQGVTTEIMGEGWTPAPARGRIQDVFLNLPQKERLLIGDWPERAKSWSRLRHWLDAMVERGVSPNIGSFLGGGTLREYARGLEMGAPTLAELPVQGAFVPLNIDGQALPSDWYLRVADEAGKMLRGEIPVQSQLPISP